MATYQLVQGDTKPQIQISLTRGDDNEVVDLTGATVYAHIRRMGDSDLTLTKTMVVNAPETGVAYIAWVDGDLDIDAGIYDAEIEVEYASGDVETVYDLVTLEVRSQLG